MEKQNLNITDAKTLEAIERLLDEGKARYKQDMCEVMGMPPQNLRNIRLGLQHFTAENLRKLSKTYGVNPSFLFGISSKFYEKSTISKVKHVQQRVN
ncbi:MAG TPA: hypothetical protein VFM70_04485 [Salinimicrobium sp.]|nr:hypothetical protein [Salinimicrobium sp.]